MRFNHFGSTIFRVFSDTPGDPGPGGGSPAPAAPPPAAPAASPSPGGPPAGTPPPQPSPSSAPAGVPAPSTPGSGQPAIPEGYLSQEQVNRIIQERVGRVVTDRDRYRAMAEAASGINFPREVDPQITEAQAALRQIFPALGLLETLQQKYGDRLPEMLDQIPTIAESHELIWGSHGSRILNSVYEGVAKALGVESLDEFQQQAAGNTFAAWVRGNPQLGQRYAYGDPKLSQEFLASWSRGFFDPVRRLAQAPAAATARGNAGLPNPPQPSGVIGAGVTGQPNQPANEEAVLDAAWQSVLARQAASVA